MKALIYLTALMLLFSIRSSGQNPDIETLKKINRDFLNSIVNRDTATLSKILADDFILINPGGIKRNKADNLSSALTSNQKISVDIDSVEVRLLSEEVALVTAWTNNKISADNKETKFKICYQDVYMKRRNKWVAVAAHVSLLGTQ
jgi:ketosteroid isomerase-like protein